jgi:phosphoribosylformylglycinamidine cyclo-ligase
MVESFSYKNSGVDIDVADATKREMVGTLKNNDERVLNQVGAFASLFAARFPELVEPVLVLKMEEPGSKQKLAFEGPRERGWVRSICFDTINHLINDIAVMGAEPLAAQDAIICGKLEPGVVGELVKGMADACRAQGCSLVGGETSEQPGVLTPGTYILTASMLGVVDRAKIIDGSRTRVGDVVLGVASNGLHTNGYSLVRSLLAATPALGDRLVSDEEESFLDVIMRPHTCYLGALRHVREVEGLHGLAHITGGGIEGNLCRVIPESLSARISLENFMLPGLFKLIQAEGRVSTAEMLKTFNCGIGLVVVLAEEALSVVQDGFQNHGHKTVIIGEIVERHPGQSPVAFDSYYRE